MQQISKNGYNRRTKSLRQQNVQSVRLNHNIHQDIIEQQNAQINTPGFGVFVPQAAPGTKNITAHGKDRNVDGDDIADENGGLIRNIRDQNHQGKESVGKNGIETADQQIAQLLRQFEPDFFQGIVTGQHFNHRRNTTDRFCFARRFHNQSR